MPITLGQGSNSPFETKGSTFGLLQTANMCTDTTLASIQEQTLVVTELPPCLMFLLAGAECWCSS